MFAVTYCTLADGATAQTPSKASEPSKGAATSASIRSLSSFTPYATAPPPTATRPGATPTTAQTSTPYPFPYPFTYPYQPAAAPAAQPATPAPERKETQNFLVHEDTPDPATLEKEAQSRSKKDSKKDKGKGKGKQPTIPWGTHMSAIFGDHVNWEEVKVLTGKNRALARPVEICPITGKEAPYLDPRSAVPFADVEAYGVLSGLLEQQFTWSEAMGCYVK
jgi:hypothetical protein